MGSAPSVTEAICFKMESALKNRTWSNNARKLQSKINLSVWNVVNITSWTQLQINAHTISTGAFKLGQTGASSASRNICWIKTTDCAWKWLIFQNTWQIRIWQTIILPKLLSKWHSWIQTAICTIATGPNVWSAMWETITIKN